jgi:2'-5' RNA ligase
MHHVVELHFDPATEKKLQAAQALVGHKAAGKPHVTLATCDYMDVDAAVPALQKVFSKWQPREINLSYLGMFEVDTEYKVLYAGVSVDSDLCALHEAVYAIVEKHSTTATELTKPGKMVFHSTLNPKIGINQLEAAVHSLEGNVPEMGRIESAVITQYPEGKEVARFCFKDNGKSLRPVPDRRSHKPI